MKKPLLLASLALSLLAPPSIANSWVRNPVSTTTVSKEGKWAVVDATDSLGDPIGVYLISPTASSVNGGTAVIRTDCAPLDTSVFVKTKQGIMSFVSNRQLMAKVDGKRHSFPVSHEIGEKVFYLGWEGKQVFIRAIREELPVKIAVPIYLESDAVFEWDMKGGAAAWKEACT